MKAKRFVSFLLLAIYLLAIGAQPYHVLTCHCVEMTSHAVHTCCSNCEHGTSDSSNLKTFKSPCCGDNHSTEVELYTSNEEDRAATKRIIQPLPVALVAETTLSDAPVLPVSEYVYHRLTPLVWGTSTLVSALRAPPVLV